jgi:hypothetical protein
LCSRASVAQTCLFAAGRLFRIRRRECCGLRPVARLRAEAWLWSAAACCRFSAASLLAPHRAQSSVRACGVSAMGAPLVSWSRKAGKAAASCRTPKRLRASLSQGGGPESLCENWPTCAVAALGARPDPIGERRSCRFSGPAVIDRRYNSTFSHRLRSPSPCGPKPPSGDGSVGAGPGPSACLPPALRPKAFGRRAVARAKGGLPYDSRRQGGGPKRSRRQAAGRQARVLC